MAETELNGGRPIRRGPYPELTLPAILVGYGIGVIIAISIGYASLKLGFSIEGSEVAAILGFGILRGVMGRTSIIENNINQTIASGVNSASAGLMFTVPALFILDQRGTAEGLTSFSPVLMVFACIAGGILGVGFIIPLRKQMIDYERLTYPGGVAVATILKSPGAGVHKALLLLAGVGASALMHAISLITGFEYWHIGSAIGLPEYMNGVWSVSLMTVGVGFISGRGGFSFVIGGFVCYWILAPILNQMDLLPSAASLAEMDLDVAEYMRLELFRPVGIGMLIGGAITGIALALPLIIGAVRSMQSAAKTKSAISKDEMPIKLLYVGIVGATILLFIIALTSVQEMGIVRGAVMALLGTIWIWVAGVVLSECIGRTNWSPLSGMTLIAVTILILISRGLGDRAAIISSMMVGAAACVAMSQATDLMLDLKTGYLVGALPKKQQIGQFLGVWIGPVVIVALIFVLHKAYTLGSEDLAAPQGTALAGVMEGILGADVPTDKYLAGAGLGALLSASGIGGLGILVGLGFYLPFAIVLTYSVGMVIRIIVDRRMGHRFSDETGIPVAAGLIVGEALIGVIYALYKVGVATFSG